MDILFNILAFLLLVGIVVTVHEGGHFFTAIACKMKIIEFSLGFGPQIYQKEIGKDKILFTLRLLPIGGFVKPLDKSTVSTEIWESLSEKDKQRAFVNSPRWKKAAMVAGGPLSNFVLAFIIFAFAFIFVGNKGIPPVVGEILPNTVMAKSGIMVGEQILSINDKEVNFVGDAHNIIANAAISNENINIKTNKSSYLVEFNNLNLKELGDDLGTLTGLYFQGALGEIKIKNILQDGAAEKSGLLVGDTITSINELKTQDLNKMLREVRKHPGQAVDVSYLRNGVTFVKTITLDSQYNSGTKVGKIGVEFETPNLDKYPTKHYSIINGASESFNRTTTSIWTTLVSLKKILTGEISTKAISGPLSIADYSGKSAQRGLFTYLMMMAAISIAVGVFNLLPIPVLDGGHLAQYTIEGIRGKDFSFKQIQNLQYVGIAAMTGIFTLAITNDLTKYLKFLG
ncbi:RIP metalloprotease RseP [archaeon]|nr:RIP metalloprotease RseP [archaeon]